MEQQQNVAVEVLSKQLQNKRGAPAAAAPAQAAQAPFQIARLRPKTDTGWRWNALPNEWIVPLGVPNAVPLIGGSVSKMRARGVVRFPSSVQRIEFSTDNISSENQGVLVEGWACWRISDPATAVQKLDLSDPDSPMLHTSRILAVECAGIMKGLISVKTVHDLLKRREDLIDRLRDKLKPTETRWGVAFDEIGVSEVQILSQEVFENLQRPFRNEAREVAATSDLDTEERIAKKTGEQKERVARLNAENASKLRDLQARNETQIRNVEIAEEKKRLLDEKEVKGLRIDEDKRVHLLQETAKIELEEQRSVAQARLAATKRLEEVRIDAEVREQKERQELARIKLALETAAAERAHALAKKEAELELKRLEIKVDLDIERQKAAVEHERAELKLRNAAEERKIMGQLSDAEIRAKVVDALPKIASSIRIGDVKWYGGSGAQDGPTSILTRAVDQVLDVAEAHGIEVRRHAPNGGKPPEKKTS